VIAEVVLKRMSVVRVLCILCTGWGSEGQSWSGKLCRNSPHNRGFENWSWYGSLIWWDAI